jgi:hypothetical protein
VQSGRPTRQRGVRAMQCSRPQRDGCTLLTCERSAFHRVIRKVVTTGSVMTPTRAAGVVPGTWAAAIVAPLARTMPVIPIVGFAVEVEVVVATAPVEVVTPARVPPLSRTPVIVRHRSHRLGFCDARRAHASKSKTGGDGSRSCDSFDVFHPFLVPPGAVQLNP